MKGHCPLTGVLLFLSVHFHHAAAAQPVGHADVVALVQRSIAARTGRAGEIAAQASAIRDSLEALTAKRRRIQERLAGNPVSLLAVNASADFSKWYDLDDGLLLQKLHDRMKANEEQEEEEMANAQAMAENGIPEEAAFLSQSAAKKDKKDALKWLTQADLEHYQEDERRLHQLSQELQRVAANIAHMATHQRDIGMHLGLPDPSTVKFEPGDRVEVEIENSQKAWGWAKATILGPGNRPNTWNIHVHAAKTGKKDLPNIPSIALRKDQDLSIKVFEPGSAKYEVGEKAQVQISIGPLSGQWVMCSIRSKAELPDTYNIVVPSAPAGHREIPAVPARVLRKAETKALFNQYDMDGDGQLSSEEFSVAFREKATSVWQEKADTKRLYQDGEHVELISLEGKTAGMWVNATVMGVGDLANSWNIFIPDANPGFQYVQNMPAERLRKVGEQKGLAEASGHPVKVIPPEADHEALMKSGPYKDKWVPCELRRESDSHDAHTIYVPFGASGDRSIVPNVLNELIRERKTCGDGFEAVFDADSPGWDHYDRQFNHKETAEECAADCQKRFSCRSFEWSPTIKECHLNKVLNPSLPGNEDYLYCRRAHLPRSPAELWKGPWIGQELEFFVEAGERNGTWQACKLAAYGPKPDTYDILAPLDFMGKPGEIGNFSAHPFNHVRFAKDRPVPFLGDNWEPPEGNDALFSVTSPVSNSTNSSETESTSTQLLANETTPQDMAPAETPVVSAVSETREPQLAEHAAEVTTAKPEVLQELPSATSPPPEPAEVNEDDLQEDDDMPEGTFHRGQTAEVRKAGKWVKCRVMNRGALPNTYNIKLLDEVGPEMKNIPALAMRRPAIAPKEKRLGNHSREAGGIDGDVGESVELIVMKGPHAGEWVPALISGHGTEPDTYDVKVPGMNSTNKTVHNVKGIAMRKSAKKVVMPEEEPQWPLYSIGERAMVVMPMGSNSSLNYSCLITGKASAVHTYDLEVPGFGTYPAASARFLRKLSPEEAEQAAEDDDTMAINLKATMDIIYAIGDDLLPVLNLILDNKRELRNWMRRAIDWDTGCEAHDRSKIVERLEELHTMPGESVAATVTQDCTLKSWADADGFKWESVATCLASGMSISRSCANCPVKFLMTVAEKCVAKCTPMMSLCRGGGLADGRCHGSAGRCLDCLAGPGRELMECAEVPDKLSILSAVNQMIKNSRGSQNMQVEVSLRDSLSVSSILHLDGLVRKALRYLLFSWNPFVTTKPLAEMQ